MLLNALFNALCEQNGTAFLNSLIFLFFEDEGAAMATFQTKFKN